MGERIERLRRALRTVPRPGLTPVTWTIAVFLAVVLGDGVRVRALRSTMTSAEANAAAVAVILGFLGLATLLAVLLRVRER